MNYPKKTFFVSAKGEACRNEIKAKNLRGAKAIASRMYHKSVDGRFDISVKIVNQYHTVAYWSGESWAWVDAQ